MRNFREILEAEEIRVVASEGVKDVSKLRNHLQNLKVISYPNSNQSMRITTLVLLPTVIQRQDFEKKFPRKISILFDGLYFIVNTSFKDVVEYVTNCLVFMCLIPEMDMVWETDISNLFDYGMEVVPFVVLS